MLGKESPPSLNEGPVGLLEPNPCSMPKAGPGLLLHRLAEGFCRLEQRAQDRHALGTDTVGGPTHSNGEPPAKRSRRKQYPHCADPCRDATVRTRKPLFANGLEVGGQLPLIYFRFMGCARRVNSSD